MHEAKFQKMVAQDPVRLSEALFAWANTNDEGWEKFAWGSLKARLSEAQRHKSGICCLALAWTNWHYQILGSLQGARLSEGMFA